MDTISISIVIPTLNAARTLKGALDSIVMQDYPKEKIEIIVADGGSTDKTLEICKEFSALNCHVVPNPLKTGEAGKAAGYKSAKNEIIVIINIAKLLNNILLSIIFIPFKHFPVFCITKNLI